MYVYGIYARAVDVQVIKQECAQRTSKISGIQTQVHKIILYKALSMWYCVSYKNTETFIIFPAFYFKSFQMLTCLKFNQCVPKRQL